MVDRLGDVPPSNWSKVMLSATAVSPISSKLTVTLDLNALSSNDEVPTVIGDVLTNGGGLAKFEHEGSVDGWPRDLRISIHDHKRRDSSPLAFTLMLLVAPVEGGVKLTLRNTEETGGTIMAVIQQAWDGPIELEARVEPQGSIEFSF